MSSGKTNYYKISLEEIENLPTDHKPTLLMHVCCGPCSCFPLTFLCPHFDVTLFFNNSNIYPSEEYWRRLDELKKLLSYYKRDYGYDVKLIVTPYDNIEYNKDLAPLADCPEGGERCHLCYKKRMSEAYDYADANKFDYFCTVMTISRQKNSQAMNEIGHELEEHHGHTKYFYSDFKKDNGILKGKELREHYELYNQLYCGCVYSYEKRREYDESKNRKFEVFKK